jgi:hypothetical protein
MLGGKPEAIPENLIAAMYSFSQIASENRESIKCLSKRLAIGIGKNFRLVERPGDWTLLY